MTTSEQWLSEVMASAKVTPGFRQRCENAALLALDIAKMRAEKERVGFVALPFRDYVEGLGKLAGVPLAPILSWFGIADLGASSASVAVGFAGLASEVGITVREAYNMMRVTVAVQHDEAPALQMAARRLAGMVPRDPLEECEAVLREIEARYPGKIRAELNAIQSALNTRYEC